MYDEIIEDLEEAIRRMGNSDESWAWPKPMFAALRQPDTAADPDEPLTADRTAPWVPSTEEERDHVRRTTASAPSTAEDACMAGGEQEPKHWSDCAVYNEPAYPNGPCDCGGYSLRNDPPRMIRLLGLDKLLLSSADRQRASELRDDPDSEDNERFASWFGDQLLTLNDTVSKALNDRPADPRPDNYP